MPFSTADFHKPICQIENYGDPTEVRNCYLVGLNDLAGGASYVQEKIAGYLQVAAAQQISADIGDV